MFLLDLLEQSPLFCGVTLLCALAFLGVRKRWHWLQRFTVHGIGIWIILWAFFSMSWINFEPWAFLGNDTVNVVGDLLPSVFSFLEQLKFHEKVFAVLNQLTGLNGLWAALIQLNFNPFLRLAISSPVLVAFLTFLFICLTPWFSRTVQQAFGFVQWIASSGSMLLLIGYLNYLDSWGSYKVFATGTLTLLLGAHIGPGPYWTLLGLLILAGTGLWQTSWSTPDPESEDLYGEALS